MKIGILGTGTVGTTIATKLVSLGHEVRMGARRVSNDKATAWAESAGAGASHATFADAATPCHPERSEGSGALLDGGPDSSSLRSSE